MISFIFIPPPVLADTVFLKNGQEIKGIVVEEYIDRIKFSTMDGEIEILKSDIKDILYDLRVQNLIKLGDFHKQKGNLARAYIYYRKAYHTDPSFEPAKTRYLQLRSIMLKRPYEQLENQIEREIERLLKEHPGLRLLRENRRLEEIKGKLQESKPLVDVIQKIIKNSPALAKLLPVGGKLPNPFNLEEAGVGQVYSCKSILHISD